MLYFSILLLASLLLPVYAESAAIVLSPDKGVSAITIKGSGFKPVSAVTIYWDGKAIPSVPLQVSTDGTGAFTCIVTVYNQTAVGAHEVKATDAAGTSAVATFTVIDLKGPQGDPGAQGAPATISPGYIAGLLLLAIVIGAAVGGFLGGTRRREAEYPTGTSVPTK